MSLWDCNNCGFAMHGDECSFYVIRDLDTYCDIRDGDYNLVTYCADVWICPKCHHSQSEDKEFFERLENRMQAFSNCLNHFKKHLTTRKIKFKLGNEK